MRGLKDIRLAGYDYRSDGFYFVTIVTKNRKCLFVDNAAKCEQVFYAVMSPIVGASIDTLIIMPDHIHLIVVMENCTMMLGEIIRRLKARTSYEFGEQLWQPNYYEHIIRNEQGLDTIRRYIINNPNKEPRFKHGR